MNPVFDPNCKRCPRLVVHRQQVKVDYPHYYAKPVPSFGDADVKLLIVGLAPGLHGANATGRPFTGDYAGILLYETLHEFGYSNQPISQSIDDGLKLKGCRITNAVKCLPPQNKPTTSEITECNQYLAAELELLPKPTVILALGLIAHQAVLKAFGYPIAQAKFAHNASHPLTNGHWLVDSYHCSRYNTQTKRLSKAAFAEVFQTIAALTKVNGTINNT